MGFKVEFWANDKLVGILVGEDVRSEIVDWLTLADFSTKIVIHIFDGVVIVLTPMPNKMCEILVNFTTSNRGVVDEFGLRFDRKMTKIIAHFTNDDSFREFCVCLEMLPPHLSTLELAVGAICRFAKHTFLACKISPTDFEIYLIGSTIGADQPSSPGLFCVHDVEHSDELSMATQVVRELQHYGPPHWKPALHTGVSI